MNEAVATRFRLLASVVSLLVLAALAGAIWFYVQLRSSLPLLDGTLSIPGLSAPVTISRDALGVPTIRGVTQADVARAVGFLHAQDRFFQMDLLRRRAAGELAGLFGKAALPIDRATRPHRFRELARTVLAQLPADQRALVENFASGANAGLAALRKKPFEYVVLRANPQPWKAEDSVLIVYAMTLDLQDPANTYERSLAAVRDQLGVEAMNFFAPLMTPNDAALDGSTASLPPTPGPPLLHVREGPVTEWHAPNVSPRGASPRGSGGPGIYFPLPFGDSAFLPGSNSFALSGAHTANGAALLANDPHLNLGVPNIWYRVVLEWPDVAGDNRVVGVTLPGLPFAILGSNGHIAWGLTDAYADTNDLVAVELNAVSKSFYKTPGHDELLEIETHHDAIPVHGGAEEKVESQWTVWGPIVGTDFRDRPLAHHWVAYDPAATNFNFAALQTAQSSAEAIEIAHNSGIPAHSFVVADRSGAIGWTIAGKFPKRIGFDGRLPVTWSYGDRRWDGYVSPEETPTLLNPPSGRLWSANNRLVGGAALHALGDGGYAPPPRGAQIRDRLLTLENAKPADFLSLQRDDRALFLERWQKLMLAALSPEAVSAKRSRERLRHAVENWEGRASTDSVSYRLVRAFRGAVAQRVLQPIFAPCIAKVPGFTWTRFNYEPALWQILQEKPSHLLASEYDNWEDLLLAAADAVTTQLNENGVDIDAATWGARNRADIRHPFGQTLPRWLTGWLNLPRDPLPGDTEMPLIQNPSFGASMRLVVSPGHEAEGIFEMPGGQSGHPLSPFYRAGHESWVRGDPSPLLPGETKHTLKLIP